METCIIIPLYEMNFLIIYLYIHLFNLDTSLKAGVDVKLPLLSKGECFGSILRGIGVDTALSDSTFFIFVSTRNIINLRTSI